MANNIDKADSQRWFGITDMSWRCRDGVSVDESLCEGWCYGTGYLFWGRKKSSRIEVVSGGVVERLGYGDVVLGGTGVLLRGYFLEL